MNYLLGVKSDKQWAYFVTEYHGIKVLAVADIRKSGDDISLRLIRLLDEQAYRGVDLKQWR